jgi:2-amino-4-hydroxy-6-hydroxymethyldihydropteridine diphosphokinase
MSHIAYLSLGSNLGNRQHNLSEAIRHLQALGRVVAVSSVYETEPVEFTDQGWFLNCALALEMEATPAQLMSDLLRVEQDMGRKRITEKGPRSIDLDILLFGDAVVNTPELTIPHPAMAKRRFVLQPLAEIAPEVRHPTLNKTVRLLLAELPEGQRVEKV